MLPSTTNNAFATSEIEIFTLPIPVQISTDITDITPNIAMTMIFDAFLFAETFFA